MHGSSSNHSTIIPERLDAFINRYAEYTHDKWAFEKVQFYFFLSSLGQYWVRLISNVALDVLEHIGCQVSQCIFAKIHKQSSAHCICVFQIQNNWSYGEALDENAKTHPMLRPYKTFSEKVISQAF